MPLCKHKECEIGTSAIRRPMAKRQAKKISRTLPATSTKSSSWRVTWWACLSYKECLQALWHVVQPARTSLPNLHSTHHPLLNLADWKEHKLALQWLLPLFSKWLSAWYGNLHQWLLRLYPRIPFSWPSWNSLNNSTTGKSHPPTKTSSQHASLNACNRRLARSLALTGGFGWTLEVAGR